MNLSCGGDLDGPWQLAWVNTQSGKILSQDSQLGFWEKVEAPPGFLFFTSSSFLLISLHTYPSPLLPSSLSHLCLLSLFLLSYSVVNSKLSSFTIGTVISVTWLLNINSLLRESIDPVEQSLYRNDTIGAFLGSLRSNVLSLYHVLTTLTVLCGDNTYWCNCPRQKPRISSTHQEYCLTWANSLHSRRSSILSSPRLVWIWISV